MTPGLIAFCLFICLPSVSGFSSPWICFQIVLSCPSVLILFWYRKLTLSIRFCLDFSVPDLAHLRFHFVTLGAFLILKLYFSLPCGWSLLKLWVLADLSIFSNIVVLWDASWSYYILMFFSIVTFNGISLYFLPVFFVIYNVFFCLVYLSTFSFRYCSALLWRH